MNAPASPTAVGRRGTERGLGARFERIDGAMGAGEHSALGWVRSAALLGTLLNARSGVGHDMWCDEAERGRAGQAFKLGEPGAADGTTADSLAASYRGPRQDGQSAKSKFLARNCSRVLDQRLGPTRARSRTNRPLEKRARHDGWARSRVGWTSLPLTPDASHSASNARSGRSRAAFGHALGGSGSDSLSLIR
jgi:hypothetical protein